MKTIKKTYELFGFDELDEAGKEKAINDEIAFYLEMDYETNPFKDAIDKAEEMQTPWFLDERFIFKIYRHMARMAPKRLCGSYMYEYHKDEILDGLRENGEHFLKDGSYFAE